MQITATQSEATSNLRAKISRQLLRETPELSGRDLEDAIDDEVMEREFDAACFCVPENGWFCA